MRLLISMCALGGCLLFAGASLSTAAEESCRTCCRLCGKKVCMVEAERTKEKKSCFEVECEEVCIPAFRWPWEKHCAPKCGRVRTVRTLKTEEFEVDAIDYQWNIREVLCVDCRAREACPTCASASKPQSPEPGRALPLPEPQLPEPPPAPAPASVPEESAAPRSARNWLKSLFR